MEIIPAIDVRDGKCVRLRQGDYARETVFAADPVATARRWADAGAPRLHVVDLDGAKAGRPVNLSIVEAIVSRLEIPVQLGGGIRDAASLALILNEVGVERAIIGTQALKRPEWFRETVQAWPGRIALGLDARDSRVATGGWLDVSETSAIELARQFADLELAAVIYTNIANDGMLQGVDQATINDLIRLTDLGLPVIASGGVTSLADVNRLVEVSREHSQLHGAIVGRALYEGTLELPAALEAAAGHG